MVIGTRYIGDIPLCVDGLPCPHSQGQSYEQLKSFLSIKYFQAVSPTGRIEVRNKLPLTYLNLDSRNMIDTRRTEVARGRTFSAVSTVFSSTPFPEDVGSAPCHCLPTGINTATFLY